MSTAHSCLTLPRRSLARLRRPRAERTIVCLSNPSWFWPWLTAAPTPLGLLIGGAYRTPVWVGVLMRSWLSRVRLQRLVRPHRASDLPRNSVIFEAPAIWAHGSLCVRVMAANPGAETKAASTEQRRRAPRSSPYSPGAIVRKRQARQSRSGWRRRPTARARFAVARRRADQAQEANDYMVAGAGLRLAFSAVQPTCKPESYWDNRRWLDCLDSKALILRHVPLEERNGVGPPARVPAGEVPLLLLRRQFAWKRGKLFCVRFALAAHDADHPHQ